MKKSKQLITGTKVMIQ